MTSIELVTGQILYDSSKEKKILILDPQPIKELIETKRVRIWEAWNITDKKIDYLTYKDFYKYEPYINNKESNGE